MRNRQAGFTLIELIIVMVIFSFVIAGTSQMFVSMLSDFKQQSKIAVTNIEGILGLEMMRRDIENAGYGLAWTGLTAYNELETAPDAWAGAHNSFNDSTTGEPRAILSGNGTGWNGTDRLVIKAVNVAMSNTCEHWNLLYSSPVSTNSWTPATDNISSNDRVIVISPSVDTKSLVPLTAGGFSTLMSNVTTDFSLFLATGGDRTDPSIVYAVDPNTDLKMPFNRADYYVQQPADLADMAGHCAQGAGNLYKAVVWHGGTGFRPVVPVLECVADMQVVFMLDEDGDGEATDVKQDIITVAKTAAEIRTQIREISVYILAQEGQRDRNYTHPNQVVRVGETGGIFAPGVGREFDLEPTIPDWVHYRWKLYTLIVKPYNLK